MAGRLTTDKKAAVIGALVEGNSIRSTERMTGVSRPTIDKLILRMGRASERLMADKIRGFRPSELQLDELWCYVGKKQRKVMRADDPGQVGDFWTWVALDPNSKLVPHAGKRGMPDAMAFTEVLSERVEGRIQIRSDKLMAYRVALEKHFGNTIDYGQIVKHYRPQIPTERRYSPPECVSVTKEDVIGFPRTDRICTSHIERQNLTIRMQSRRFTRLTNAFSKRVTHLKAAVALHFAYYNFGRRHGTIRTTPAIAAGLADRVWTIHDLVEWGDDYGR